MTDIESFSTERCWIVPNDEMFALETALAALPHNQGGVNG